MKLVANIFREYDIRGNAEEELTSETVRPSAWPTERSFRARGSGRSPWAEMSAFQRTGSKATSSKV
jgi:phosphomannomutase